MKTIQVSAYRSNSQLIARVALNVLLVLVTVMYSGLFQFLVTVSPYLLYGFYVALGVSMAGYLVLTNAFHRLQPLALYLIWLVFFCMWGTLVSASPSMVLPGAVRVLFWHALIAPAVALIVESRRNLEKLATLFLWVAIINCAIALQETIDPQLISQIAYILNPYGTAFSVLRPAGLWSNPNEAAYALVYALLISYWARGRLVRLGRVVVVIGIYLTASRSGAYLLVIGGAVHLWFYFRSFRFDKLRAALLAFGIAALALSTLLAIDMIMAWGTEFSKNWTVNRLLDFSESEDMASGYLGRRQLTALWLRRVMDQPWLGYGLFAVQGSIRNTTAPSLEPVSAHNIYLAIAGETGIVGLATYLLVVSVGINRLVRSGGIWLERMAVAVMWLVYLLLGFVWHNQLTASTGIIYIALMLSLPAALLHDPARTVPSPMTLADQQS